MNTLWTLILSKSLMTWHPTSRAVHIPRRMTTHATSDAMLATTFLAGPIRCHVAEGPDENRLHVPLPVEDGVDVAPTWPPHGTTSKHRNTCSITHVRVNIAHVQCKFGHVFACFSWSDFRWCSHWHCPHFFWHFCSFFKTSQTTGVSYSDNWHVTLAYYALYVYSSLDKLDKSMALPMLGHVVVVTITIAFAW